MSILTNATTGLKIWRIESICRSWSSSSTQDLKLWYDLWLDQPLPEIPETFCAALRQLFGGRVRKNLSYLGLKSHAILYHNPTNYNLNITSLGLVGEDGDFLTHVAPGALVSVPTYLTLIGRLTSSPLHAVAPQLVRYDDEADPSIFDMTPTSYEEWIRNFPWSLSTCCNRPVLWSDTIGKLCCLDCGKLIAYE